MASGHKKSFSPEKLKALAKTHLLPGPLPGQRDGKRDRCRPQLWRHGRGAQIFDYQGREFCDYDLLGGALIYGHAHRNVTLGVKRTAERGIALGSLSRPTVELAEFICRRMTAVEQVAFFPSAAEATETAIQTAQAATGRNRIILFKSDAPQEPRGVGSREIILPYNNGPALEEFVFHNGKDIAAILFGPLTTDHGISPATKDFLLTLSRLCRKYKLLLICDEITTAFRFHCGGLLDQQGLKPDLTILGGIIGGGFSLGAVGCRKGLPAAAAKNLAQAGGGTRFISPVVMQAGLSTLRLLNDAFYSALNQRAHKWVEGMNSALLDQGVPVRVDAYLSMFRVCFLGTLADDLGDMNKKLRSFLLKRGIYFPENEGPCFFSGRHRPKDLLMLKERLLKFCLQAV